MSWGSRPPSKSIVVDANIVLGAAIGQRSRPSFDFVWARRSLATSARASEEVLGRARGLGEMIAGAAELATGLPALTTITDADFYVDRLARAAEVLRLAPASRNGSSTDAHVLALAWTLDADIWSHDRDFAGAGWPSWSSANLRAALADA